MNHLKKLALVAALSLFGLSAAHAAAVFVPADPGQPGQTDLIWDLGNATFGNHAKGSTFDDFFTFNVPDSESVEFTAQSVGPGVKFEGFALYITADGTLLDLDILPTPALSLSGGPWSLTSGTYTLELAGVFTKRNGTYTGFIDGTPAVPEPANWALMLAGLGAMGTLARRRANTKA